MNRPSPIIETAEPISPRGTPRVAAAGWSPLVFFRQFLAHPLMVGSIIPTSSLTIRALLDHADWSQARVIVEYGPGTGVFTRELLHRARSDAVVIAIDTNKAFVDFLETNIRDARLSCVEGSAAMIEDILKARGIGSADVIVSGLPFSTLPPGVGEAISAATARALRPGGLFLVYQYSRLVIRLLRRHFPQVDEQRVWRCMPPARLFVARKAKGG